jgi:hypothetical protein
MWFFSKKKINQTKEKYFNHLNLHNDAHYKKKEVTKLMGIHIDNRYQEIKKCSDGEELMLVREPNNNFDSNAIAVIKFNNKLVEYIPKQEAQKMAPLMDSGKIFRCTLAYAVEVNNFKEAVITIFEY